MPSFRDPDNQESPQDLRGCYVSDCPGCSRCLAERSREARENCEFSEATPDATSCFWHRCVKHRLSSLPEEGPLHPYVRTPCKGCPGRERARLGTLSDLVRRERDRTRIV